MSSPEAAADAHRVRKAILPAYREVYDEIVATGTRPEHVLAAVCLIESDRSPAEVTQSFDISEDALVALRNRILAKQSDENILGGYRCSGCDTTFLITRTGADGALSEWTPRCPVCEDPDSVLPVGGIDD